MSTVEVKLLRADRIFHPGELLEGVITVRTPHPTLPHLGIWVKAEGTVNLQVNQTMLNPSLRFCSGQHQAALRVVRSCLKKICRDKVTHATTTIKRRLSER